jgi:uncharacterized membrane protein (Fun14 family)
LLKGYAVKTLVAVVLALFGLVFLAYWLGQSEGTSWLALATRARVAADEASPSTILAITGGLLVFAGSVRRKRRA